MTALGTPVPILRIFDEQKAREFYCGYLSFTVVFEHRFEPALPLYLEIRRDDAVLHLSEHHGDSSPGARIRIAVQDIEEFHRGLAAKDDRHLRPAIIDQPWGMREMTLTDPFSNRLTFFQSAGG